MNKFKFNEFFNHYIINSTAEDFYLNEDMTYPCINMNGTNIEVHTSAYSGFIFHFMNEKKEEFSINFGIESYDQYLDQCLEYVDKRILDMTYNTGTCELLSIHIPKRMMIERFALGLRGDIRHIEVDDVLSNIKMETGLHKNSIRNIMNSTLGISA